MVRATSMDFFSVERTNEFKDEIVYEIKRRLYTTWSTIQARLEYEDKNRRVKEKLLHWKEQKQRYQEKWEKYDEFMKQFTEQFRFMGLSERKLENAKTIKYNSRIKEADDHIALLKKELSQLQKSPIAELTPRKFGKDPDAATKTMETLYPALLPYDTKKKWGWGWFPFDWEWILEPQSRTDASIKQKRANMIQELSVFRNDSVSTPVALMPYWRTLLPDAKGEGFIHICLVKHVRTDTSPAPEHLTKFEKQEKQTEKKHNYKRPEFEWHAVVYVSGTYLVQGTEGNEINNNRFYVMRYLHELGITGQVKKIYFLMSNNAVQNNKFIDETITVIKDNFMRAYMDEDRIRYQQFPSTLDQVLPKWATSEGEEDGTQYQFLERCHKWMEEWKTPIPTRNVLELWIGTPQDNIEGEIHVTDSSQWKGDETYMALKEVEREIKKKLRYKSMGGGKKEFLAAAKQGAAFTLAKGKQGAAFTLAKGKQGAAYANKKLFYKPLDGAEVRSDLHTGVSYLIGKSNLKTFNATYKGVAKYIAPFNLKEWFEELGVKPESTQDIEFWDGVQLLYQIENGGVLTVSYTRKQPLTDADIFESSSDVQHYMPRTEINPNAVILSTDNVSEWSNTWKISRHKNKPWNKPREGTDFYVNKSVETMDQTPKVPAPLVYKSQAGYWRKMGKCRIESISFKPKVFDGSDTVFVGPVIKVRCTRMKEKFTLSSSKARGEEGHPWWIYDATRVFALGALGDDAGDDDEEYHTFD